MEKLTKERKIIMKDEKFNKDFFSTHFDGATGRAQDNGHYYNVAIGIARAWPQCKIHEVGAGRGYITRHLKTHGFEASGMELSQWAVDNAVCEDIEQGDILYDLKKHATGLFDLVISGSVMAYFEENEVVKAFQETARLASKNAIFIIQNSDMAIHFARMQGLETEEEIKKRFLARGRRCFKPFSWFLEKAIEAGLTIDEERMKDCYSKKTKDDLGYEWAGRPSDEATKTTIITKGGVKK